MLPTDPSISIVSSDGTFSAALELGAAAGRSDNQINLSLKDLSVEEFASKLKSDGQPPLSGGTMNIAITGKLSSIDSNLKIKPTFKGSTLNIAGNQIPVDNLSIPISLRGPIDNPAFKLDSKAFQDAIAKAGKKALLNAATKKLGIDTSRDEKLEDKAKKLLNEFLKKKSEDK